MKPFYLTCLLVFSLIVVSCTPLRVVRLEPDAENTTYRYGEKVVTSETPGARIDVSFYDASPRFVVFNLEVENTGTEPFDFDPATCLLVPDAGPVTRAIDPEVRLLSMDIETIRDERGSRTLLALGAGLLVAGVAFDVAGSGDADAFDAGSYLAADLALSSAQTLAFNVVDVKQERNFVRNVIPYDEEIPTPANRYFWLDHALRITTVEPGQKVFGKIAFPRNDEATSFSFNVAVNGEEFRVPFNQLLFKP